MSSDLRLLEEKPPVKEKVRLRADVGVRGDPGDDADGAAGASWAGGAAAALKEKRLRLDDVDDGRGDDAADLALDDGFSSAPFFFFLPKLSARFIVLAIFSG